MSRAASPYGLAALRGECEIMAGTTHGRNAQLNRSALRLGSLVCAGFLGRRDVETKLFAAAVSSGYVSKDGEAAARATIASGLAAGLRSPRRVTAEHPEAARTSSDPGIQRRAAAAKRIWNDAVDPAGSVVERYLASRGLGLPPNSQETIRFDPRSPWRDGEGTNFVPAMVCVMRSVVDDRITGIHRTRLTPDGGKVERRMLGAAAGAAIKLDPDEDVEFGLTIGEGVESCLAAREFGLRPVWAMASSGGVASFPALNGIDTLTILEENDDASRKAVRMSADRWVDAGREVLIVRSRHGSDANDAWRAVA